MPTTTDDIRDQFLQIRERAWSGKIVASISELEAVIDGDMPFDSLPTDLQITILCFQAGQALIAGHSSMARRNLERASTIAPASPKVCKLRSMLAFEDGNFDEGLALLESDDPEVRRYKAWQLLNLGRIDEAATLAQESFEPSNADALQLNAAIAMVRGDLDTAAHEIRIALLDQPRWERLRFVNAQIQYYACLPVTLIPKAWSALPATFPSDLIIRSREVSKSLRSASSTFAALVSGSDLPRNQQLFEIWELASLANDSGRRNKATTLASEITGRTNSNHHAVEWILARELDVDLGNMERTLEQRVASGSADAFETATLARVYIVKNNGAAAKELLDASHALFNDEQLRTLWLMLSVQSLVSTGQYDAAVKMLDDSSPSIDLTGLRAAVLGARSGASPDDLDAIQRSLEERLNKTDDPLVLLELCELLARRGQWAAVAARAGSLLDRLPTAAAADVALTGLFNSGHFSDVVNSANQFITATERQSIPERVLIVRTLALVRLGKVAEALNAAEDLVDRYPSADNLDRLAQIAFSKGDLDAGVSAARRLVRNPKITAEQALRSAFWVVDRELTVAAQLWRRAVEVGVPDELVSEAVTLGHRLGRGPELKPLFERMAELGQSGQGGITVATTEQLIPLLQRIRARSDLIAEQYRRGDITSHAFASGTNTPLAALYHGLLERNLRKSVRDKTWLYARHGVRSDSSVPDSYKAWRLNLDVTAFLLAAHLDILPQIERTFADVKIPYDLVGMLKDMEGHLSDQRRDRLDLIKTLLTALDDGRVASLSDEYERRQISPELSGVAPPDTIALYTDAQRMPGYVLDFLPLRDVYGEIVSSPPDFIHQIGVNARHLAELLVREGRTSQRIEGILTEFGNDGLVNAIGPMPEPGTDIVVHYNAAESFLDTNLFEALITRNRLVFQQSYVKHLRQEHDSLVERERLASWLRELINHINTARGGKGYNRVDGPPIGHEQENGNDDADRNALSRSLDSLLTFHAEPNDVIWIDDRWCTSFPNRDGGVPIIGTSEILKALRDANAIDDITYFEKLLLLRNECVFFLPLEEDELAHHIGVAADSVPLATETEVSLQVLRQYTTQVLLQKQNIQRPVTDRQTIEDIEATTTVSREQGSVTVQQVPIERSLLPATRSDLAMRFGEIPFLANMSSAIGRALQFVFTSLPEISAYAYADWILDHMYFDDLPEYSVAGYSRANPQATSVQDAALLSLLVRSTFFHEDDATLEPLADAAGQRFRIGPARQRYLNWILNRLILPKATADPELIRRLAKAMALQLERARQETNEEWATLQRWPTAVYLSLPFLQQRLLEEPLLRSVLKALAMHAVGTLRFDPQTYAEAASIAIRERKPVVVRTLDDKQVEMKCDLDDSGAPRLQITSLDSNASTTRTTDTDSRLGLFGDAVMVRNAIDKHRLDLDISRADAASLVDRLVAAKEIERTRIFDESLHSALPFHLKSVLTQISPTRPRLVSDFLARDDSSIARFLRLARDRIIGETGSVIKVFEEGASRLLEDVGVETALRRYANLPILLPSALTEAYSRLDVEAREGLLRRFLQAAYTPTTALATLQLLSRENAVTPELESLRDACLEQITAMHLDNTASAFVALARWTSGELSRANTSSWSVTESLINVWVQAGELFSILRSAGVKNEAIIELARSVASVAESELLSQQEAVRDAASTRGLRAEDVLLAGFSAALEAGTDPGRRLFHVSSDADTPDDPLHQFHGLLLGSIVEKTDENSFDLIPGVRKQTNLSPNTLDSYLGLSRVDQFRAWAPEEVITAVTEAALDARLSSSLDRLLAESATVRDWSVIVEQLDGNAPADASLRAKMTALLRRVDFASIAQETECWRLAVLACTQQATALSEDEVVKRLRDELLKSLDIAVGAAEHSGYVFDTVFQAALNLSMREIPSRRTESVVEFMEHLAVATHFLGESAIHFISSMARRSRPDCGAKWNKLLLYARAS